MRRVAIVALALLGLGVAAWFEPWEPGVPLLTGTPGFPGMEEGCFTDWAEGPLVIDAKSGTAIIDNDLHASVPVPVMWRPGYTARRVGSEVEVLDPIQNVVATTGRSYRIAGGYVSTAFFACDFVIPQ